MTGRASLAKDNILDVFNKHSKTRQKNSCSVNSLTPDCKCCVNHNKTHGRYKMKRLKSRKERSQMRGGGKETLKTKSHRHHYQDHSSCHCRRRDTSFPNVFLGSQEPSIITDNRLIGHHGLFNHEVKSIDIERLLSQQRKQEKREQQVPEKNHVISHPSLTSHNPPQFSSKHLSGADTDEVVPFVKKTDPATHTCDCCEKEKKISQGSDGSDVTPGQRPRQELDPSSGSCKGTFSSKRSSLDAVTVKSKKTHSFMSERGRNSEPLSTGDRDNVKISKKKLKTHVTSTLEHTPKNRKPPIQQTQAHGLSPSPLQLSSSSSTKSTEIQHRTQDPSCVSKSVSEVAARLCDSLHFPFLRRRNLVAESREVLLRALQERHGPRLQENLLKLQRPLSFGVDLTKAMINEDVLFPADASTSSAYQADPAIQQCFDTHRTTSLKMKGSGHFNWSSLQPHNRGGKIAEWLSDPTDTFLDGAVRPSCSPGFCMDSKPPGTSTVDHFFSPSATSCWPGKASTSQHWEDSWARPQRKESFMFDSFENSYFNHSGTVRESCGSQYSGSNLQPLFPYPAQLPNGYTAETMHFPQEPDPFVTDRYSYAPTFSAQIHNPNQSNYLQTFSQFSHPSACPPIRSHNTDMMHYSPSHMLEIKPAPPFTLLSPEQWSFPTKRLY